MTNMELFLVIMSFVSPITVGLFVKSGIKTQIRANDSSISKQVKEELEKEKKLLEEKIRLEREDRWWNVKLNLCLEISEMTTTLFELIPNKKYDEALSQFNKVLPMIGVLYSDRTISTIAMETHELISGVKPADNHLEIAMSISKSIANIIGLMREELKDGSKLKL